MRSLRLKLLGCLFALALGSTAQAAILYVDKDSGCPGNGGTSTPFCTIQNALNVVNAGDTIRIRDSATPYDEAATLTRSGASGNIITIEPDTGHNPTLRRTNLNAYEGAMTLLNVRHVKVQNLTFDNTGVNNSSLVGLFIRLTTPGTYQGISIIGNTIKNWGGNAAASATVIDQPRGGLVVDTGFHLSSSAVVYIIDGLLIQGNTFDGNRQSGMSIMHTTNSIIENNTVLNTRCAADSDTSRNSIGIKLRPGCQFSAGCQDNLVIRNNIIHDIQGMSVCDVAHNPAFDTVAGLWCDVGFHNVTAENNLIYNVGQTDLAQPSYVDNAGIYVEHNCKNWLVRNNIVKDTGHNGFKIRIAETSGPTSQYYNNTIVNNPRGIYLFDGIGIFKNNIIQNSTTASVVAAFNHAFSLFTFDYNLYYNPGGQPVGNWAGTTMNFATWKSTTGYDASGLNVDPRLANVTGLDFRLCTGAGTPVAGCPGTSQAIDAGTPVGIACNGPCDMGALESGGSASTPAAHWKMDESGSTTTAVDSSGNNVHMSLCQTTTCGVQGPTFAAGEVNNHAVFNGTTHYMEAPHNTLVDFTGDWTFAAWVATTSTAHQQIISKENTASCGTPYSVEIVNSHYLYYHCGPTSDESIEFTDYTVPTSGVHHVAMRRIVSTKTVELYIDGTLTDSGTWTGTPGPATNTTTVRLGKSHVAADPRWFAGTLDEVRLANRALTAGEIQALADEGTPTAFAGISTTHHRWYSADKNEGTRPLSAVDGTASSKVEGKLRVRFSIANDTGASLSESIPLACAVDGGTAFVLSSSCATNPACITTDSVVANNTNTTNLLPIDVGLTFTPGKFINGTVPPWATNPLPDSQCLEHEYSVRFTGLTVGQDLCCFPVYGSTNALFDGYNPAAGACLTVTGGKQVHR